MKCYIFSYDFAFTYAYVGLKISSQFTLYCIFSVYELQIDVGEEKVGEG